jgi:Family of unknown function (DUF6481)
MRRSKAPDFVERRNAATNAKKAALEKFRAHADDPGLAERQTTRAALAGERTAAKMAREIEKAERKARDAELAMEAKRAAEAQAERALAEAASRELALQTERKAARDARYAARKARSKRR